jgi:hypothetical protein
MGVGLMGLFNRYRAWSRARRTLVALVPTVALALGGVGVFVANQPGASAATAGPDQIIYSQQNGKNGQYLQYVPGDGSKSTTQAVTGGGGCATPNVTNPVLAFSAVSYPNGYSQPSTPAIVGTFNNRTGVCAIPQAWSIEVGEGLIFAPGPNALTTGRLFSRAQLVLEREDKAGGTLTGQVILKNSSSPDAPVVQAFQITAGQIQFDTGVVPTGFDSIEIRVLTPASGSISVVGPTSTFTLANKICPGQAITQTSTDGTTSSGQVTATVQFLANTDGSSTCKSYTSFVATSTDPTSSDGKSVTFLSTQLATAHIKITIDWGNLAYCRGDATVVAGQTACPTTLIDFGQGFQPETYCAAATTSTPMICTVDKHFTYIADPADSSKTVTHEVEVMDALGDARMRF